jgi:hypothetical protein
VDLLARISVQQGKFEEAKQLWQAAAKLDPANPEHRVALRKLNMVEKQRERPALVPPVAKVIIIALAAIIVALTFFIGYSQLHKHHPKNTKRPAASVQSILQGQWIS